MPGTTVRYGEILILNLQSQHKQNNSMVRHLDSPFAERDLNQQTASL